MTPLSFEKTLTVRFKPMTYLGNLSDWPPLALGEHKTYLSSVDLKRLSKINYVGLPVTLRVAWPFLQDRFVPVDEPRIRILNTNSF